jgi:hypothetical protein
MEEGLIFAFVVLAIIFICSCSGGKKRVRRSSPPRIRPRVVGGCSGMSGGYEADYQDYIMDRSLEPSISSSHERFVSDSNLRRPLKDVELSTEIHPGNWIGLRRPCYDIKVNPTDREVPSFEKYQYPVNSKRCLINAGCN